MRPEEDDSITGFNEAMDIVRDALKNPVVLTPRTDQPAAPVDKTDAWESRQDAKKQPVAQCICGYDARNNERDSNPACPVHNPHPDTDVSPLDASYGLKAFDDAIAIGLGRLDAMEKAYLKELERIEMMIDAELDIELRANGIDPEKMIQNVFQKGIIPLTPGQVGGRQHVRAERQEGADGVRNTPA
jgi:hypothetical protein